MAILATLLLDVFPPTYPQEGSTTKSERSTTTRIEVLQGWRGERLFMNILMLA
jgi:hypothetical protein